MTMRIRLFLSFVTIVLITIASVLFIAGRQTAQEVRKFMYRGGMTGTEELVAELESYYKSHHSWAGVEQIFSAPGFWGNMPGGHGMGPGMMGGMMGQRLRLADAEGNILFDTANPVPSGQLSDLEMQYAIPLYAGGEIVGHFIPEGGMAFSADSERNLLSRLNRSAWLAGAIGGTVSILLALLLAHRLLRPIRDLTRAAAKLAEGDLTQRVPVRGDDELSTLGRTFNQMASALQRAEESRRSMTADIAHELRTPLSVQRAHLEALQDGIYPLDLESLQPIQEQNHLLTRLVEDLRTLALADAGELRLERVPTDLGRLVNRVVDQFSHQANKQQVKIEWKADGDCPPISLDPARVEQILNNLLDNALRHVPQGGTITLTLSAHPGQVVLSVRDDGPGIPPEALPHIFERFYRVDKGRSRSEGGTGLGLSIARKLAQALGGDLTAENHPQGGAVFKLTLPC